MENLNKKFEPIRLISTNVISRKGYFYGKISRADTQFRDGNQILRVEFRIAKGKYRGFSVITTFSNDFKSKVRLSYLCNAVGITERAALSILRALEEEEIISRRKEGRRNRYTVNLAALLSHRTQGPYTIAELGKPARRRWSRRSTA